MKASGRWAGRRAGRRAVAAGLAFLPLLLYLPFILGDELANADVFLAYRPAHAWLTAGLRAGGIPFWNPYLLGGFPLAFTEYGWFSPLNWAPLLLLGPHSGYYLAVALYVTLSGLAAGGLGWLWGARWPGVPLAGAVYALSLMVVGGAPLINQGAAYWALPALLGCVQAHYSPHPSARLAAPLLGVVVALTLLGSHPQQALIAGLPAVFYVLYLVARVGRASPRARSLRRLVPLAVAGALGAGVAAVRYLPTLPLLDASARAQGLDGSAAALGSVSPLALLAGLTYPSLDLPFGLLRPQWTAYVGPLPLLLAALGAWGHWRPARDETAEGAPQAPRPREVAHPARPAGSTPRPPHPAQRAVRRAGLLPRPPHPAPFLAGLGLAGVLLAFGGYTPLYWAISRTPLLSYFREPSRFLLWFVLAVAIFAAWGVDGLARRRLLERRFGGRGLGALWWLATVAVALSALGLVVVHAGLSLNERAILNTLRLRAVTQARGTADYPVSFYVEGADAGWRQALRATDPLSPGLLGPLSAMVGTLWWWRWGRRWSSAPEVALLLVVAPLALYAPVRLPRIAGAVVQETPPSVEIAREADAETAPGAGLGQGGEADRLAGAAPALTPRAYAWLPLATDFEARRRADALGQDADTISYRLLKGFLAPNLGTPFAVPVVDGYENLMTREQALLVAALGSERAGTAGDSSPTGLTRLPPNERRQRLAERWGLLAAAGAGTVFSGDRLRPEAWPPTVRYERAAVPGVGGAPDLNVYRFTRPLPRAFIADSWAVAMGPQEALGRLLGAPPGPDGGPPVVVVAPRGSTAPRSPRPPGADPDANGPREARIVRYEPHTVEVETESDREGLLVLLDANAPGWTATVTGAPATVLTANVAFRAVAIPAGRHLVTFSYVPPGWGAALGVTLLAALALALWGAWLLVAARPADRYT